MSQWKTITDFPSYKISALGEIKKIDTKDIVKASKDKDGYNICPLYDENGIRKHKRVHRLVAEAFIPNPNNYDIVRFINGDRTDVQVENLEWVEKMDRKGQGEGTHKTYRSIDYSNITHVDVKDEKWREYNHKGTVTHVSSEGRVVVDGKVTYGMIQGDRYMVPVGKGLMHVSTLVCSVFPMPQKRRDKVFYINGNSFDNRLKNLVMKREKPDETEMEFELVPIGDAEYYVSKCGRVKYFDDKGQEVVTFGYIYNKTFCVDVKEDEKKTRYYVKDLVYMTFTSRCPVRLRHVYHINGNLLDNRLENLAFDKRNRDYPKEIWKPSEEIKSKIGKDGYFISNMGRLRLRNDEPSIGSDQGGYRVFNASHKGKTIPFRIHRLVALAFIPTNDTKKYVNHISGNKSNNCVYNLEWVTPSENTKHAFDTGLASNHGLKNAVVGCKYDEKGKLVMREYDSASSAATNMGLNQRNISSICNKLNPNRRTEGGMVWRFKETVYSMTEEEFERDVAEDLKKNVTNSRPVIVRHRDGSGATYPSASMAARKENIELYKLYQRLNDPNDHTVVSPVDKKTLTEEHKKNVSKGKQSPVNKYTKEGVFMQSYDCAKDAVLSLDIEIVDAYDLKQKADHVTSCCSGVRKTCYGHMWRWKRDGILKIDVVENKHKHATTSRKVYLFDRDTKEIVNEFRTIKETAEYLGISESTVRNRCKDLRAQGDFYMSHRKEDNEFVDKVVLARPTVRKTQSKKVYRFDIVTKICDKTYNSCREAAIDVHSATVSRSVQKACESDGINDYRGYLWSFNPTIDVDGKKTIKHKKDMPIVSYDMEGNVLGTFNNTRDAAESMGMNKESVRQLCTGRRTATADNVVLRYENDAFDLYPVIRSKGGGHRKRVYCFDPDTRELVVEYDGLEEAAKSMEVYATTIGKKCKVNAEWEGYVWSFSDSI